MSKLGLLIALGIAGCMVEGDDLASVDQGLEAENAIYNNAIYNNAIYNNGTFENGYAITNGGTGSLWEKPWARVWSGPKANGFSIAYARKWGANFFTSTWVQNSTAVQYVDNNGTACSHPTTRVGTALASGCSSLAQAVCASDSYCCSTGWDQTCVNEAADLANDYTGGHAVTVTGPGLLDSYSGCAALVNAGRSSCRTNWTSDCVEDAFAKCYARYVTRPRLESGRLIADACVEPAVTGTAGCTNASPFGIAGECCRRSLVLYGVYQDFHKDAAVPAGDGYKVQWSSWEYETAPAGTVAVRATMVPEPCTGSYVFVGGQFVRSCAPEHHLWQLAGPGKPFYPDVPDHANTSTGEWNATDPGHQGVSLRRVLVNLLTALTNTSGHYVIDLRYARVVLGVWFDAPDPGLLPPAAGYDDQTELVVDDVSGVDTFFSTRHYTYGRVLCKGSDEANSKRTDTDAPVCSSLDYSLASNRGGPATIRTLWNQQ